jgi:membrane protein
MRLPVQVQRAWHFLRRVHDRYHADRGPLAAAAISFFAILSLIPSVLLGLAILGSFVGKARAREEIHEYLVQFLQQDRVVEYLDRLARDHSAIAGVGTLGLIIAATPIFLHLETALDVAWRAPTGRHFLLSRGLAFVMTLFAGALLLVATLTTWLLDGLRAFTHPYLPALAESWIWSAAHQALPFLLTLIAFATLYMLMPNAPVRPAAAWIGALAGALMWEALKWLFTLYLKRLTHLEPIYGSLTGVVALFIWVWYSSVALVLGAEVGAVYQESLKPGPPRGSRRRIGPANAARRPPAARRPRAGRGRR